MIIRLGSRTVKISTFMLAAGLIASSPFTTARPVSAATRQEVGIATSATLLRMNDVNLDERMSNVSELGAQWVRVDFSWRAIQPDNAQDYVWDDYDRLVFLDCFED